MSPTLVVPHRWFMALSFVWRYLTVDITWMESYSDIISLWSHYDSITLCELRERNWFQQELSISSLVQMSTFSWGLWYNYLIKYSNPIMSHGCYGYFISRWVIIEQYCVINDISYYFHSWADWADPGTHFTNGSGARKWNLMYIMFGLILFPLN